MDNPGLGAAGGGEIDQGKVTLSLLGNSAGAREMKYGLASWDHKFVDTYLTLHWEKDRLIVERFDIFKDKSGRSNYRKRSEFKKRSNNSRGAGASVPPLSKARYYIRLSQWDKAAAEYAKADLSGRALRDDAFAYACLFLIRGDSEGYNRFCQRMIQRAAETKDPFEAYVLARSCAMARKSPVDPARAVQWANQAVASTHNPWDFHVLGLAQYRAGQFDQALQSFTKANVKAWTIFPDSIGSGWPWFTTVWAILMRPGNVWTRASNGWSGKARRVPSGLQSSSPGIGQRRNSSVARRRRC